MEEKTIGLGILIACIMVAGILIVMAMGGFDTFAGQRRAGMMTVIFTFLPNYF